MTKAELIQRLTEKTLELSRAEVDSAVRMILEFMCQSLESGERIEIRDFGSFNLTHRVGRVGRNPRTGQNVIVPEKYVRSSLQARPGAVEDGRSAAELLYLNGARSECRLC